ncbi:MAG: TraB/GumN family protein [Krumholzibacteria bacterium]|nr:TraB/GumN family protein [Candidatus Krumholzibacteria bacterium]
MRRYPRFACVALALALAASAVPASAGDPLYLWRIAGERAVVHLTGSVHVGRPDFFPLADVLEQAFADADALAVEVDIDDPANQQAAAMIMMQKALLTGDETLQTRLGEEVWGRLEAYARERGVPLAMYGKFKPGIVAMVLMMQEYQRQGFDPNLGIDKHFLDQARQAGTPIRQLETIEAQFELFLQVDDQLDDVLMAEMLDQMGDIGPMTERMVALWKAGDADGMERFMAEQTGDEPEMVAFYRALLDDRNLAMADSVDAWLRGDADVFVVVGAGHFGGEVGLVKLLRDKGWDVEQVER